MEFYQSLSEEAQARLFGLAAAGFVALGIVIINLHNRIHRGIDDELIRNRKRLGKCETDIAREQGRHD